MTNNDQLSIRLLPGGFSYTWGDRPAEFISLTGNDSVAVFEDAILSRQELLRTWELVICELHTSRVAVLPADLPMSEAKAHYDLLLPEADSEETVLCDNNNGISFWFGINARIYHFLQRTFLNVVYRHPLCSLHAYWQTKVSFGTNDKMIADLSLAALQLLVYRDGDLHLAIRHETGDLRNMTYLILNTWHQLQMNHLRDLLILTGDTTLCSKLQEQIQEIIKNVTTEQ